MRRMNGDIVVVKEMVASGAICKKKKNFNLNWLKSAFIMILFIHIKRHSYINLLELKF